MQRPIASFSLLGVSIRLDASWILLALLIAWSLAAGVFPDLYRGLPQSTYWGMAAASVVGIAASIILHELGHTLVARAFGLPIKSITLFVFGGVAEMEGEPKAPRAELFMALAGPLVSVALGFGFSLLANFLEGSAPTEYHAVLHYLGTLNFTLAAFNMAPAFPLDGGRVLRALIWLVTGDSLKATRIAARSGEVIAVLLMGLGAFSTLTMGLVHGLWWIVLGWFILSMASAHRKEAEARQLLSGMRVGDLMTRDPVSAADLSLPPPAEGSAEVAARVAAARAIQTARMAGTGKRSNAELDGDLLELHGTPDEPGRKLLLQAAEAMRLSARGYTRMLRVARTIADLAGSEGVGRIHVAEALSYRRVAPRS